MGMFGVALLAGMTAGDAHAQSRDDIWRLGQGGARTTVRATSPTPPPAPSVPAQPAYPVAFTLLPAILMSDGGVYANFGFGYEPVSRACGSHSRVIDGRGHATPQRGSVSPAPGANTPSAQNLPSVRAQREAARRAALHACYARDPYGRLVVIR